MKFIGMTMRVDDYEINQERRDAIDQRWYHFLRECGITPILLQNNWISVAKILEKITLSGLILSGGNSLMAKGGNAPERDGLEANLLAYAAESKVPVIGVCRGMQVIQQFFGVELQAVENHAGTRHIINFNKQKREVNSYHHFGTFQSVKELEVLAISDDGVIESIQHQKLPIKGIMWHPEREMKYELTDIRLFRDHFSA